MIDLIFRKKRAPSQNFEHHLLQSSAFYAGMFAGIFGSTIIFIIDRVMEGTVIKGSIKSIFVHFGIPDFYFTVAFNLGAAALVFYLFIFYYNLKKTVIDEDNQSKEEGDA